MKKFFENFTDKKFLMSLIAVVAGVLALFNIGDNTVNLITSLILIILPVIGYIVSEGIVDWNRINTAISEILNVINNYLKETEEETNVEGNEIQTEDIEKVVSMASKASKPYKDFENKEREIILRIAEILKATRK